MRKREEPYTLIELILTLTVVIVLGVIFTSTFEEKRREMCAENMRSFHPALMKTVNCAEVFPGY